ncbi:hypothetical protein IC607_04490 [Cellulomonas sp. JH27-2]|uniref:hypothetical protein n=1 Tax=Cellulomonas sp. JH27-2 TaxID=2774139 RepID=UPI00177B2D3E|nr:hypothetical protein [Cellulomonas sp. JH27-2]MBD8058227.1 hypothetical protein [Cellulomonas sp. JH27-2]
MATQAGPTRMGRPRTWRLVALLLLVAPVSAEYLAAYDPEVTGQVWQLVGGLAVLAPLYGAPAVLIHEVAARTAMHWTGILTLGGAFGVLQAGVVDQSLFALSYLGYADWGTWVAATMITPLGVSGAFALNFLVGHAVWSIGAPVALVEAFDRSPARRPWLGVPGIAVLSVLWVLASVVVWRDIRDAGSDQASVGQLVGAVALAAALVVVACTWGRRPLPTPTSARVPPPGVVLVVALALALGYGFVPGTWAGVAGGITILAVAAVVVVRWSRSATWGRRHVAAVAGGAVVARAIGGFVTVATTTPRPPGGFAQNVVLLVAALALVAAALARRPRPHQEALSPLV